MVANCPHSVHNALHSRHLLAPTNECRAQGFNFFLQPKVFAFFKACYDHHWSVIEEEALYAGKSLVKRAAINHSQAFDTCHCDRCTAFVKVEVNSGAARKARLIQANVNEATAYENPREYYACLKALADFATYEYTQEGVVFQLVYAGGMDHDQLSDLASEWLAQPDIAIDERDGKNWDASMQRPMMQAILDIYKALHMQSHRSASARYPRVRGAAYPKDGFSRIVMKYVSCWKRLSGDWDTTFGNTAISMMCCVFSVTNLPPHLRPTRVQAFFMGDDYWAVYKFRCVPDLKLLHQALDHYDGVFGITPERALFLDPCATSFISLSLWPRRCGGYQFVPKPAKQLRKLFWSHKVQSPRYVLAVRNGICINFYPVYQGFEMMQRFLKVHYTPSVAARKFDHFYAGMFSGSGRDVDWPQGFSRKYTVPFEATRFEFPTDLGVYHNPVVEVMLREESLDPIDRPGAW